MLHKHFLMLEKWEKKPLDKEENLPPIFMDLSEAFDTTNHDLLLARYTTWKK